MGKKKQLKEDLLKWRRFEVARLKDRGKTVQEIAEIMHIEQRTVYYDLEYVDKHADDIIRNYLAKTVPSELRKFLSKMDQASNELWRIADNPNISESNRITAIAQAGKVAKDVIDTITNNKPLLREVEDKDELLISNSPEEEREKDNTPAIF